MVMYAMGKKPDTMPVDHIAVMKTAPFDEIIMRDNGLLLDSAQIDVIVKIKRMALSGGQSCVKYPDSLISVIQHGRSIELRLTDKAERLLLANGMLTQGNNKEKSVDTVEIEMSIISDSLRCYVAPAYVLNFDNINMKKLECRYPFNSRIEISGKSMIERMRLYSTASMDKEADRRNADTSKSGVNGYVEGEPHYLSSSRSTYINISYSSFIKHLVLKTSCGNSIINGEGRRIGTLTVSGKGGISNIDYDVCDKLFVFPTDSSTSVTINDIKQKIQLK